MKESQQMLLTNYVVRWGILAASPATLRLLEEIEMYGPERAPVLITGETGTGKERVTQALHDVSGRKGRLVAVNCGSIAPDLIESLLFGYVRGAFTGASGDKKGYFEEAEGGTIFLDEIGDMPMKAQVALLRVLQERKVRRLGDINEKRVDVRVVAATHCDLERMVSEGVFRRDLYYRLRGLTIHIPALRERRDEIQPLTDYFLRGISDERGRKFEITENARMVLLANTWRGNIRELMQCLEAAAVRARDGIIDAEVLMLLPEKLSDCISPVAQNRTAEHRGSREPAPPAQSIRHWPLQEKSYSEMMDEYERNLLQATLDACGGSVSRAAVLLKMSAITLRRRIRILGVERKTTLSPLLFTHRGQPFHSGEVTSANFGD
jgi:DNA-binding NtrC family response regulator